MHDYVKHRRQILPCKFPKTIEEVNSKSSSQLRNAVVGLDGFVDKIVAPVKKRHGLGDQFDAVETISEMGEKITAAAGKSANIELFLRFEKFGGNGPIMKWCFHWE